LAVVELEGTLILTEIDHEFVVGYTLAGDWIMSQYGNTNQIIYKLSLDVGR